MVVVGDIIPANYYCWLIEFRRLRHVLGRTRTAENRNSKL